MCGGKTPSGVRDARPSHRPSEAKPSAINASIQPESSPAAFRLSALRAQSDSPVFQLPLEIRGYAAVFGSIIETSLSAVWVMRWVFAGLVRFRNRSFDLLRRDGPCRLPDGFVHWTHLLAWISMTFYLIKAAERRTRFALDLRSFSNFICSTER